MPKKICPNGHIYDSTIYGDECPLCPQGGEEIPMGPSTGEPFPGQQQEAMGAPGGTRVTPPSGSYKNMGGDDFGIKEPDAAGQTILKNHNSERHQAVNVGAGTVIRQPKGTPVAKGRKLVGFLVTYNRTPSGKSFELYEGKNYIGREKSCDICIPDDNQISGRHMSILYRNVDNKFKYRDEQSSNGTFVNKELSDEGELQNFDIIRLGSTIFIFIAIPQLGQ